MSENKRKHPGKQDSSRKRYKSNGSRITSTTIHGPGVFVTCVKGKERFAGREIRDVFESIALDLWPPTSEPARGGEALSAELDDSDEEDSEEDDLEARILRDRAKIHSEKAPEGKDRASAGVNEKARKRIIIHYTDTPCLLFASCASPIDPVALTLAYLDEVKERGVARTRVVQRLEPIANTCVAALPELLLLSEKVLEEGFKNPEPKGYTYKVVAKVRNNSKLSSLQLIEEVPRKVPSGHSVSLKSPELTILVVVFKSVAGIGVAPRYEELKKYNVTQLVEARDLDVGLGETSRLKKAVTDNLALTGTQ